MAKVLSSGGYKPPKRNKGHGDRSDSFTDAFSDLREDTAGQMPSSFDPDNIPEEEDEFEKFMREEAARPREPKQKQSLSVQGFFGLFAVGCLAATMLMGFFGTTFLSDHNLEWVLPFMFGLTFFCFGILILSAKQAFGVIFLLAGGAVASVSFLYGTGDVEMQDYLMYHVVPLLGALAFFGAGLGFIIIPPIIKKKKDRKYSLQVNATVVHKEKRVSRHQDSDGHSHTSVTYPLTWRYVVDGQEYKVKNNSARGPEPRNVGDSDIIYIDPENPADIRDKVIEKWTGLFFAIFGIVFAVPGAVLMFLLLTGSL